MVGVLDVMGWAGGLAWQPAQRGEVERLKIAVAPAGLGHQFYLAAGRGSSISGRRWELSCGIDRRTGVYIPELAEKWEMAPDGKSWTIWLRQGVKFHDNWGIHRQRCAPRRLPDHPARRSRVTGGVWRDLMGWENGLRWRTWQGK